MRWQVASGPEETRAAGFDGVQWRFRLEDENGHAAHVLVGVSGTALAVARVPDVTAEAIATRGLSAIDAILAWPEPPTRITLTTAEVPSIDGGVPPHDVAAGDESAAGADASARQEIDDIRQWFEERGFELALHQPGGPDQGWFAPFMRRASSGGSAAYGWGRTPLEAARDARREFRQREEASSVSV